MNLNISKKDAQWLKDTLKLFIPHDQATERIVKKIDKQLK